MRISSSNARIAILVTFIGVSSVLPLATDLQSQVGKTWEFRAQSGIVRINLLADPAPPKAPSLEILYDNEAHPSLAEEVRFIREVLNQLPAIGVNPHSLSSISMRGFTEPEVAERIAVAALHSKEWQSFTTITGGAEQVVKNLLNSSRAYYPLNDAFRDYGLVMKLGGVEKVASARCLDLKLSDPDCNARHNPRVPVGANLYFGLVKKSELKSKTIK